PEEYVEAQEYNYGSFIANCGLWIAGKVEGDVRANVGWWQNNLTPEKDGVKTGLFVLNSQDLPLKGANWPSKYGAPVDASHNVKIYGDDMALSVLFSDTTKTESYLAKPIKGLRVVAHIFGYQNDRVYLQNQDNIPYVMFFRYDLYNDSQVPIQDAYIGFWVDTDLNEISIGSNSTGYDMLREMSYTYTPQRYSTKVDPVTDSVYTILVRATHQTTGYTFLQSPEVNGTELRASSHRIMRKNSYDDPDFGETGFSTPEQVYLALQGLSNTGQPMIDPTTGQASKFAFTGDPVKKTGWLDVETEVRSMISVGPFDFTAGETHTVVVGFAMAFGDDLAESLTNLKNLVYYIKIRSGYWK
ncbi:MAG: hypothetical protein PHW79_03595, partial [Candidatus Marinimicrobia bacterium]|nr:hypothetical protein [Candidatus Neomarinimicrobiota bacterium]